MSKILEKHSYRPGDRFFEPLWEFLLLNSALAYATNIIRFPGEPIAAGASSISQCNLAPFWIRVPLHGVLEAAMDNDPVSGVEISFVEFEDDSDGILTTGLKTPIGSIIASVFTNFYEAHEPLFKQHINSDKSQWPELITFMRIVRNSLSHGWRVNLNSPKAVSGRWRGFEYGHAQHGRQTINGDLGAGDILLLMKEGCEEICRLGLPLPPSH